MPPDAVTRVSDYITEIIAYIIKISGNGYCYAVSGFEGPERPTYLCRLIDRLWH